MKHLARIVLAALSFPLACAHTKTTDDGSEKQDRKSEAKAEKPQSEAKAEKPRAADRRPHESGGVPLATSPAGLLAPGADEKIHDRLVAEGFLDDDAKRSDAATSEGLRRFQRAHDLPATGIPDDKTVKDLGLDPGEVFRRGTVKD
ncbi:MAG TPA: peptidoglycan-binding domain-containing protein [Polyangia bacterium]|jgi:hypothetical protein